MLMLMPLASAQVAWPGPLSLVVQPPQDDCDTGADAGEGEGSVARVQTPVDCAGVLTTRDLSDGYAFNAYAGQFVEVVVDPDPAYPYMQVSVRDPSGWTAGRPVYGPGTAVSLVVRETGDVTVMLDWFPERNIEFDYRLRVRAVGETPDDPHDDCGTGSGAANDHAGATLLQVPVSCVGTLRGADAWDFYRFPVLLGQDIDIDLDVDHADHETCLYTPHGGRAVACSTNDWGIDEQIRWTNASVRGDWRVVVYRYSGDDDYGLSVAVHGEPANEPPGVSIACPHTVDAGEAFTCTLVGSDFDSDHLRFFVRWNNGPEQAYPAEGTVAPGEPYEFVHVHETPGRSQWLIVTVRDDGGAESWNYHQVFVRGLEPPQQDCGTDGDAGDSFDAATPLALPRVACATSLTASLDADAVDWYAIELEAGDTLRARLDDDRPEPPRLCAYTPSGGQVQCTSPWQRELVIPVDTTGTWRLAAWAGIRDFTALLSVSVETTVARGVQVLPGIVPDMSPAPMPEEAAPLEGAWVDLPASETGERGLRVAGQFRARFYDAAGELLEEASGRGGGDHPWMPVPAAATRAFVDRDAYLAPDAFEVTVYH